MAVISDFEVLDLNELKFRFGVRQARTVVKWLRAQGLIAAHWGQDCDLLSGRLIRLAVEQGCKACDDHRDHESA